MSNSNTTKVLDTVPEHLHKQLFAEVQEKIEADKKKKNAPTEAEINELKQKFR